MLDTIIKLLERFVVAHELIAKTNAERGTLVVGDFNAALAEPADRELPVEGEDVIDTPAAEEKPKRKPKTTRPEPEPEYDLSVMREEIKMMAGHVAAGESDKCADLFDELLEEFKVRTVPKLADDQVEDFHKRAKALVSKYYKVED